MAAARPRLLESIAAITGAVPRKGSVAAGSSLGDASPESRARQMSVEMNVLTTHYLGEEFTFLDCPGSIEFLGDTLNLLPGIDAAVVVCEPDAAKAPCCSPSSSGWPMRMCRICCSSTSSTRRAGRCARC